MRQDDFAEHRHVKPSAHCISQMGLLEGLSGALPPALGRLAGLTYIDLASNMLSGSLPAQLPASLQSIRLSGNMLTGTIPASYGAHASDPSRLYIFWFTGVSAHSVAAQDQHAYTCDIFWLAHSFINFSSDHGSTCAVRHAGNLAALKSLEIAQNAITGSIPDGALDHSPNAHAVKCMHTCFHAALLLSMQHTTLLLRHLLYITSAFGYSYHARGMTIPGRGMLQALQRFPR